MFTECDLRLPSALLYLTAESEHGLYVKDADENIPEEDASIGRVRASARYEELSCPHVSVDDGCLRVCGGAQERLLFASAVAQKINIDEGAMDETQFPAGCYV